LAWLEKHPEIGGHFHETYDTAGNDGPFPADHRYRSPSVVG